MNFQKYIPTGPDVVRETIVALVAVVAAAWILSRFPVVKKFVQENSLTVQDQTGNVLF
jgi:hypothetical protein